MKVYWHRELPPLDAAALSEHVVEADSVRARASRDEAWLHGRYTYMLYR